MKLKRFGGFSRPAGGWKVGHRARTYKQARTHANILPSTCITLFVFGLAAYAQDVQTPRSNDKLQTQPDARDRNLSASDNAADRSTTRKLISNVWLDQKDIWTSPFRMDRGNAKWWLLVGVAQAHLSQRIISYPNNSQPGELRSTWVRR
jgi:hypothetical protein